MKKTLIHYTFILIVLFISNPIKATHMMGSDITYRCVSPLRFEITLKWYRDCRGIELGNAGALTIRCSSSGDIKTTTLVLQSIREITPVCAISSQNGSTSMHSSTGGIISEEMMNKILTLKKGDFILIERLDEMDPYDQTRKRYPSVNFKLE